MNEEIKIDPDADVDPGRVEEATPFDASERPLDRREEVINTANKAASEVRGVPDPLFEGISEAATKRAKERRQESGLE